MRGAKAVLLVLLFGHLSALPDTIRIGKYLKQQLEIGLLEKRILFLKLQVSVILKFTPFRKLTTTYISCLGSIEFTSKETLKNVEMR